MNEKPTVKARLNWGNWIADCPVHGEGIAEKVKPGEPFICSRCHPGTHAMIKVRYEGRLIDVPDVAAQSFARQEAAREGQVYDVIFPSRKQMQKIMRAVRQRKIQHMNWRPGMTIADLETENKKHGVA